MYGAVAHALSSNAADDETIRTLTRIEFVGTGILHFAGLSADLLPLFPIGSRLKEPV